MMHLNKREFLQQIAASFGTYALANTAGAEAPAVATDVWASSTQKLAATLLSPQANGVISPLSIWSALAMVHAGAQGETAKEITQALQMPNDPLSFTQNQQVIQQLQHRINKSPVKLHTGNRVWLNKTREVLPSYLQRLRLNHQANPGLVDFVHQPKASRERINDWISQQTQGLVPELLGTDSITSMTRLVLTQAMYLKAPWAHAFDPRRTHDAPFTLTSGHQVAVPMMHQAGDWLAGEIKQGSTQIKVVELPYSHDDLRMVLFVPSSARGLADALALLQKNWASKLSPQAVLLSMPRWKARQSQSLTASLQQLGMRLAFTQGRADFSGISAEQDLYISAMQHEAYVEVSEQGTEAAAATAAVMTMRAAAPIKPPLEVRADRPFAWAVVDSAQRGVLFAGVVHDPRLADR